MPITFELLLSFQLQLCFAPLNRVPSGCSTGVLFARPPRLRERRLAMAGRTLPSAAGGFSFSLSSGKGEKKEHPVNPVNPV